MWRAPCKGGVYQWVRDPPGYRASPRAVEPQLLHIHSSLVEHRSEVGRTSPYPKTAEVASLAIANGKLVVRTGPTGNSYMSLYEPSLTGVRRPEFALQRERLNGEKYWKLPFSSGSVAGDFRAVWPLEPHAATAEQHTRD
jgi:hypothetical protein